MPSSRGKIPRFNSAANKIFDRAKFLDGTYKTYFSPQLIGDPVYPPNRPDAPSFFPVNQQPKYPLVWPYGMTGFGGYSSPSDWPSSGQLLRVPQVVCFSFDFQPIDAIDFGIGGGEAVDYDSELDYVSIAPEIKRRIELIRKGITFVNMCSYAGNAETPGSPRLVATACDSIYFNNSARLLGRHATAEPPPYPRDYYYTYFPYQASGLLNPQHADEIRGQFLDWVAYIIAPQIDEDFFGVDFLHIYATNQTLMSFPYVAPPYAGARDRLVASYPRFSGYSVYMYSGVRPEPGFEVNVLPAPVGPVVAICEDLKDYGYNYGGDYREQITVDNMVKFIAKHYGFDPDTGKDLPVT